MPGRQSYSAQIAIVSGPEPAVATNAVGRSQTPGSTRKPAASSDSASHDAACSSSNPSSGCAWMRWLSATRSSRARSKRSRTPAFGSAGTLRLAAEQEVVVERLPVLVRAADEDVVRDAAEVVDHVAVDEAREPDVVLLDRRPAGGVVRRHAPVVDRGAGGVVVDDEVAGAGEPRERLVIVAPELAAPARRPAEALLEDRERGERVL